MRTVKTATMMLVGSVMMAQAAGAGPLLGDAMRRTPRPISTVSVAGQADGLRPVLETVRIEQLPIANVHDRMATVQFMVQTVALRGGVYRAQLSMNGELVSQRSIAAGTPEMIEAPVPVDHEVHGTCVTIQRVPADGAATTVAQRCFDVMVGTRIP